VSLSTVETSIDALGSIVKEQGGKKKPKKAFEEGGRRRPCPELTSKYCWNEVENLKKKNPDKRLRGRRREGSPHINTSLPKTERKKKKESNTKGERKRENVFGQEWKEKKRSAVGGGASSFFVVSGYVRLSKGKKGPTRSREKGQREEGLSIMPLHGDRVGEE